MTDVLFYAGFITASLILYLPARWAKTAFSGEYFTSTKFWVSFSYNFIPGYLHLKFAIFSTIPFYGYADNSIIELFSLIMAGLHANALPAPWKRKLWGLNLKKSKS